MKPAAEFIHESFMLHSPDESSAVLDRLKSDFSLLEESVEIKRQEFYDTFDYKLHGKGLLLSREGGRYVLGDTSGESIVASLGYRKMNAPSFWWEFPESRLREKLGSSIDVRALLPQISVERRITTYRVLNEDEKTVSFLSRQDMRTTEGGGKKSSVCTFTVRPVRGYGEEARKIEEYLSALGLSRAKDDILSLALESAGRSPGDYSSKINVTLEPDMPAARAAKIILLSLLDTIKRNESGILEDIDTEFLHDFRVAVRRTRSALTLIKGVFPQKVKERYKREFAGLGRMTNRLRDLDIYLLKREQYRQMLPPVLRSGLDPLFSMLERERREAFREFRRNFPGPSYRSVMTSWEKFLNGAGEDDASAVNADVPVVRLAKKYIRKQYGKAIRLGAEINDDSPDSDLHVLRIECKKLRYLLEFFESLFPEKEIKQAVKQLKGLQDNLGDFNDLHVQQESLKTYLSKLDSASKSGKESIVSAGGLISILYHRQEEIRSEFSKRFDEFGSGETKALFDNLFSGH